MTISNYPYAPAYALDPDEGRRFRTGLIKMATALLASMVKEDDTSSAEHAVLETRFMAIVNRHNALITKICFYFASSNSEFDDLRQDTLLNLWRGLKGFRGESEESTWLYRVCFNTCVSTVKRNSKASMPGIDDIGGDICDMTDDESESNARIAMLHYCISRLNPVDRSIVMMQLDGKSYEEISKVVGMNRNTVATRLNRARKRLATMITNPHPRS